MRNGQIEGTTIQLIVVSFVILAIMLYAYQYRTSIESSANIATCKATIESKNFYLEETHGIKGKAVSAGLGIKDTKLRCPVHVETIATDELRIAHARITEQLYDCWDKTRGLNNKLAYQTSGLNPPTFCLVCGRITPTIEVPTDTIRNYITGAHVPGQTEKRYRDVLATSWGAQSPIRFFIQTDKPQTIPLPNQFETGTALPRLLKDTSYDVISMNLKTEDGFQSHVFVIPTTHIKNLGCAELHQEVAPSQ